jgi:transcriptional regulator with XRE-family HTH domain
MPKSVFTKRYEVFRKMLVEARLSAGMTQRELSDYLGFPQSYVSKYENGERRLDVVEFLQIAEALNINIIEFIVRIQGVENEKDD